MRGKFLVIAGLLFPLLLIGSKIQAAEEIRLIVRGDDMGSSHAANEACIKSYKEGIMRSVELMVPGPWFPEAVRLLQENPGLDVGIHLVLTSEWANLKWRPVSCVPSLVDADGYFFPMVWQNPNFPPNTSIQKSNWKLDDVEKELRAQIETALRHPPNDAWRLGMKWYTRENLQPPPPPSAKPAK
jgi:chitin disaccharide deacetylase